MNELSPYSCFPVRPLDTDSYPVCGVGDGDDGWEAVEDSHIPAVSGDQQVDESGDILSADDDEVVQRAVPMPAPITPSKREVEIHNLTHLPYRSWCKHCVAARRPNSHHRRQPSSRQRTVPLLVADYAYVRDHLDKSLATVLVARLLPSNLTMATVCDEKGLDPQTVARLAQFIKESGYSHLVYKSDQEFGLRALFEEAFTKSTRQGELFNPRLQQMVPEASSVGESQSNGRAEIAV